MNRPFDYFDAAAVIKKVFTEFVRIKVESTFDLMDAEPTFMSTLCEYYTKGNKIGAIKYLREVSTMKTRVDFAGVAPNGSNDALLDAFHIVCPSAYYVTTKKLNLKETKDFVEWACGVLTHTNSIEQPKPKPVVEVHYESLGSILRSAMK